MPERLSQPAETTDSLSETRAVRHCADNFRHTARIVAQAIEDSDYSYGIAQYCEEPLYYDTSQQLRWKVYQAGDDDYAVTIYLLDDGRMLKEVVDEFSSILPAIHPYVPAMANESPEETIAIYISLVNLVEDDEFRATHLVFLEE